MNPFMMRSQQGSISISSERGSGSKTISSTPFPETKRTPWANPQLPENPCGSSIGFKTITKRNQLCGLRIVDIEDKRYVIVPLLSGASALLLLQGSLIKITVDEKQFDVCPRWLLYCLGESNEKDKHKCSRGKCYEHHLDNPLCFFHSKQGCSKKGCDRIHAPELRFDVSPNIDQFMTFELTPKEFPGLMSGKAVCCQLDVSAWREKIEQSRLERQLQDQIKKLNESLAKR